MTTTGIKPGLTSARQEKRWRQTGRTQAMCEEALEYLQNGFSVLILADKQAQASLIRDRLAQMAGKRLTQLRVVSITSSLEWRGHIFDKILVKILVDHFAWETQPFMTARALLDAERCIPHVM